MVIKETATLPWTLGNLQCEPVLKPIMTWVVLGNIKAEYKKLRNPQTSNATQSCSISCHSKAEDNYNPHLTEPVYKIKCIPTVTSENKENLQLTKS